MLYVLLSDNDPSANQMEERGRRGEDEDEGSERSEAEAGAQRASHAQGAQSLSDLLSSQIAPEQPPGSAPRSVPLDPYLRARPMDCTASASSGAAGHLRSGRFTHTCDRSP